MSLFLLYSLEQNHLHFLEYIQLFWIQILFLLLRTQMRLDLYKKDFDIIPTYTSLVLLIFERLSTFHKQAHTLSGSDLPYHFVGFPLILRVLYPRAPSRPSVSPCPIGRTSTSTSLMPQLVQAVIPPRRDASVGLKRFGEFKAPVGLWSLSPWNEKARF